jgi:hypothetical protein
MRYFMIGMGVLIGMLFLLAILANPAQAGGGGQVPDISNQSADGAALACLTLVVGTALLAGVVWLGTLRELPAKS